MIDIREIQVGDMLRYPDNSGPVKVTSVWPYAIEIKLGLGTEPVIKEMAREVRNPISGTRWMINMIRDQAHDLLYK